MSNIAHPKIPWAEMPFFLALAKEKTLSGAARRLRIDRTTVARRIEGLEAMVERALFDRLDGKFELTQLGRKAFAAAERADQELAMFGQPDGKKHHAMGKVRLSLPAQYSLSLVEPLTRFQRNHPEILLELAATDRLASLTRYETDVALRLSRRAAQGLASYKLGYVSYRFYHSLEHPVDLTRYISYPGGEKTLGLVRETLPAAEVVMSVDGYVPLREYIAQGVGVGMLPTTFGDSDLRLQPVSKQVFQNESHIWLLCLPEQKRLYRVEQLMRFLRAEFEGGI